MRIISLLILFMIAMSFNNSQSHLNSPLFTKLLRRANSCNFFSFEARVDENKDVFFKNRETSGYYLFIFTEDKKVINECIKNKLDLSNKCEAIRYAIGFYPKSLGMALSLLKKESNDKWANEKVKIFELFESLRNLNGNAINIKKFRNMCSVTDDGLTAFLIFLEFRRLGDVENSNLCFKSAKRLHYFSANTEKAAYIYNKGLASDNFPFLLSVWSQANCKSNIGLLYQYGLGVEKNLNLAEKLYLEDINEKSSSSYRNLAQLYEENPFFGKSKNEINDLYSSAMHNGDFYSQLRFNLIKK